MIVQELLENDRLYFGNSSKKEGASTMKLSFFDEFLP
jgi:hypothetical protein